MSGSDVAKKKTKIGRKKSKEAWGVGTMIKVRTKLKTVRIRHVDLKKGVQLDYPTIN